MSHIANWLNTQLQARQADLIVDETLFELKRRDDVLKDAFPMKTYAGRRFMSYITKSLQTLASVIAFGAELPTTTKGQFRKVDAEMFKFGLSHVYDEELQWQMKEAMQMAKAMNMTVQNMVNDDGSTTRGQDNDLAALLFGNVQGLVRGHADLLDVLTWQVVQYGEINYSDVRSNVDVALDWKDSSLTPYNHFPAPLTGAALWTNYSTANGIQDLYDFTDTYVDTNGFPPDEFIMSRKLFNHLAQQESSKQAAASMFILGGNSLAGTLGLADINAALDKRELPKIRLFDERYQDDTTPGLVGEAKRFHATDRFSAIKKNMGQRAMGGTIENDDKEGIFQRTYEKEKVPALDVTQVVSVSLPISVMISRLGGSRQVA